MSSCEQMSEESEISDEFDEELIQKANQLQSDIDADPYNFAAFQELIEIQRNMGDLEIVRTLRNKVHASFMLPEEMWLEWLKDEIMCEGANNETNSNIKDLFQLAFADYQYETLSYKFLKYITKSTLIDKEYALSGFEQIISVFGQGGKRADKIWRLYSQFTQNSDNHVGVLKRWACTPIISFKEALLLLKNILNQDQFEQVQQKSLKSARLIPEFAKFESQFQECLQKMNELENIQPMLELLESLKSSNYGYSQVRLYFERLLPQFTLNSSLWKLYIELTLLLSKEPEQHFTIHTRALKNLFNSSEIWASYIREQEAQAVDFEYIIQMLDQAIAQVDDRFILQQLGYEVRARKGNETVINEYFQKLILELTDPKQQEWLMEKHSQVLCYKIQDQVALSELMVQFCRLAEDSYKSWHEFINKVKSFRDATAVRKVFIKAFRFCTDKKKIGRDWYDWEKLFGDEGTLQKCEDALSRKLPEILLQNQVEVVQQNVSEKVKEKVTLFLKNLHKDIEDTEIIKLFGAVEVLNVRVPRDEEGKHKGIAFVDVGSHQTAENALQLNNTKIRGIPIQIYISKPPAESSPEVLQRTVFVSGIPVNCLEKDLRDQFSLKLCNIEEIRLIRDSRSGKPKGFAYVQFTDQKSYGIATNPKTQISFQDVVLTVEAIKSKDAQQCQHRLLVSNLPFRSTDEALADGMKQVFNFRKLQVMKEGDRSKGYGFVYFDTVQELEVALSVGEFQLLGRLVSIKEPIKKDEMVSGNKRLHQQEQQPVQKAEVGKKREVKAELKVQSNQDFKSFLGL